jgi:diguanylate cyclase (GGDEF)-like protein
VTPNSALSLKEMVKGPLHERPSLPKDIKVFHDVARALTSSLDLDTILGAVMRQMAHYFEPETWSLLIVDEQQRNLYYALAAGESPGDRTLRVGLGEGIAGWVAQHGEMVIVAEPGYGSFNDGRFTLPTGDPSAPVVRSAICMPLRWQDRTLGVIELLNYRVSTLTDETMAFLNVLCDYAAIAIQNVRAVERIQELTITDDCTGLFNSRHLFSVMEGELERSRRFGHTFSLIFIDLDHFKTVNDVHGHLMGSRLLAEIAKTIRHNVRGIDSAFRYGGDEFIVLLPQTSKDAALEVAQRLLQALRTTKFLVTEGLGLQVMASFGIASYPEDGDSAQKIIAAADEMMYMVKNSARGNIAIAQRGFVQT